MVLCACLGHVFVRCPGLRAGGFGFGVPREHAEKKACASCAPQMDSGAVATEQLKRLREHTDVAVVPLCALDGRGVEKVTMGLRLLIQNLRAADEVRGREILLCWCTGTRPQTCRPLLVSPHPAEPCVLVWRADFCAGSARARDPFHRSADPPRVDSRGKNFEQLYTIYFVARGCAPVD